MPEYLLEDHEVTVAGSRDEVKTQKTPDYVSTMDLDVANIDKMIKTNEGTSTRQLMNLTLERLKYPPNHLLINIKKPEQATKTSI